MRDHASNLPVCDFLVPEGAPAPVAAADEHYRGLVEKLNEARAALSSATDAVEDGRRQDVQAMADAMRAGKPPANDARHEREAQERVNDLARQVEAAEIAVDEAGSAVAAAIEEAKPTWLTELRADVGGAEARFATAIEEAQAAADVLITARHVAEWLAPFEAGKLERGNSQPGEQRLRMYRHAQSHELRVSPAGIPGAEVVGETVDVTALLAAAGRAVDSPQSAEPSRAERRRSEAVAAGVSGWEAS